jgi:hypothetical protein
MANADFGIGFGWVTGLGFGVDDPSGECSGFLGLDELNGDVDATGCVRILVG